MVSNAAMHWMPDQDAVIAGVRRVLAPGGRFVAEMGGVGNVAAVRDAWGRACAELGVTADLHPWAFPTPGEQAGRLERHGFTVDLVQRFARPTPLGAGMRTRDWLAMFAAAPLGSLDDGVREQLLDRVDALTAPLVRDGVTVIDYVRLRWVAHVA